MTMNTYDEQVVSCSSAVTVFHLKYDSCGNVRGFLSLENGTYSKMLIMLPEVAVRLSLYHFHGSTSRFAAFRPCSYSEFKLFRMNRVAHLS